jgi:hypothetical protein
MLLLLVAGNALLLHPALASRQGRQSAHIAAAATAASVQDSGSSLDAWPRRHVHSPFNSEASMQIAARQRLFDYAVTEALEILGVAIEKVKIPEYRTTLEIPVIGGIDVVISNVNITDLQVQPCTIWPVQLQHYTPSSWVEAAGPAGIVVSCLALSLGHLRVASGCTQSVELSSAAGCAACMHATAVTCVCCSLSCLIPREANSMA